MNIFLATSGLLGPNGSPGLWAANLLDPLVELGHTVSVSELDWDTPLLHAEEAAWVASNRAALSERLVDEVKCAHRRQQIDLFLSYFYSVHAEPAAIGEIRRLGIPTVNFYCNAAHQFHLVAEIAPAFDYCWVPEKQAVEAYRRAGARPLHIQMGANPRLYRPIEIPRDVDASFVGMLYADRLETLARMSRLGVPLSVYSSVKPPPGRGDTSGDAPAGRSFAVEAARDLFTRGPGYLARRSIRYWRNRQGLRVIQSHLRPRAADLAELFSRSHAVFNLSHVFDRGLPGGRTLAHVRLRDFEAPLCRCLFFPQYSEELPDYYDLQREVVAWKTPEEAAEKIRYYRRHPAEAEAIREAGYRRALAEHTAAHRFQELFSAVGLSARHSTAAVENKR